ncbi:MAG: glycosyltransferase family 4 protein [Armatimonadetes bacterium]|nr:glycosyltransferase family 4 protein [Armatimonadota bacterium]
MKALLVAPAPPPEGGMATWTQAVLAGLAQRDGLDVRLLDTAVRWRSVTDLTAVRRLIGGAVQGLRDNARVAAAIGEYKPDLVHVTTSAGFGVFRDRLMAAGARRRGAPVVMHYHFGRIPALSASGGWEWRTLCAGARQAARQLVLDRPSADALQRALGAQTVRVQPNMVDAAALGRLADAVEAPAEGGRLQIVFVGHAIVSKGIADLVSACASPTCPDVELRVVGPCEAAYEPELRRMAAQRRAGDWLTLSGRLPHGEALSAMASAHLVALPSASEGFPNVVVEAMALGRCVLATPVGAIPEMLADGACGVLTPVGDVGALARSIAALDADRTRLAALATAARLRAATRYDGPQVLDRLVELWREATATRCT